MAKKKNAVRKDGRIAVQVYLGLDGEGKRKYKTVYGQTQKEADDIASEVRAAIGRGIDVTAARDTFGEWARRWLPLKTLEVGRSQEETYTSRVNYLSKFLKDTPIQKIKHIDLQEIINSLAVKNPNTGKPTSKRLLQTTKSTLFQIFELAILNRVLDFNPVAAVKISKNAPASKRRALTDTEKHWIHATQHRAKTAAMIMLYAGLRRGELIPLTWSDIDLKEKTINVSKSVERVANTFVVKDGAKTEAGVRTIDIPDILADFLSSQKREGILICEKVCGGMHTESSFRQMWDSYLSELNYQHGDFSPFQNKPKSKFDPTGIPFVIEHITPHMLRHTFATMLYFAGVDVLTAADQLGHSNPKMTLSIYTHLDKVHKRKSMSKLNDYLKSASQMQVSNIAKTQ